MVLLGVAIERVVLRPLVNRPPIDLFMATLGLELRHRGRWRRRCWGSQVHGLELGIDDVPLELRRRDRSASSICSRPRTAGALVLVLGAALQPHPPRPRAARGRRRPAGGARRSASTCAASGPSSGRSRASSRWSPGCSGARALGVQFSLSLVVLKALPVLIIGGFISIAGTIVGGLLVGATREAGRGLPRARSSAAASRTGFPTCSRCCSCWCGRPACSAKPRSSGSEPCQTIERLRRPVATSLGRAARRSRFRWAVAGAAGDRLRRRCRCSATTIWFSAILIPFLVLSLAGLGLEPADRLRRPALARLGRVHGGRRLRRLQLSAARAGPAAARQHRARRADARRWSAWSSACRACASRAST